METALGEEPTGVEFTVLIPWYSDALPLETVSTDLTEYLQQELFGGDYYGYVGEITNNPEDYSYLLDLAADMLPNVGEATEYYLAKVIVMPVSP